MGQPQPEKQRYAYASYGEFKVARSYDTAEGVAIGAFVGMNLV